MPPAPLLRTARIPESTIPRALCAAGQRRGPVVPASVHRSAAALPGSAVDRARVAPGSESSGPPGKSTRVGASSARGRVSGLRAHTVDWRAARRPPAIPGAPSRVRPESALGSTQCACPSPPRPSRPPTLCRRGSFFLESVVLCAPWVMTSWDASLLAERAFLYGVVTRISTEANTHAGERATTIHAQHGGVRSVPEGLVLPENDHARRADASGRVFQARRHARSGLRVGPRRPRPAFSRARLPRVDAGARSHGARAPGSSTGVGSRPLAARGPCRAWHRGGLLRLRLDGGRAAIRAGDGSRSR